MGVWTFSAFLLTLIGLIFTIVSLATDSWTEVGQYKAGLWRSCFAGTCSDIPDAEVTDKLKAIRAFVIIGLIFGLVGALMVAKQAWSGLTDMMKNVAIVVNFIAGLCLMIAMAIFVDSLDTSDSDVYGYSFVLLILGWLLFWAAIPLIWLGKTT